MMQRGYILLAGMVLFLSDALSQGMNLGNPPVVNFSKQKTEAGTQTWDISHDEHGIIWFANNNGLLEFDGVHWRMFPLSNSTIVRSVRAGKNSRVYVGGQDELGCFMPDAHGNMQYHSFKVLLPESDRHFGEVWDIEIMSDESVYFRTDHQVFRYSHQQLTPLFPAGTSLSYMGIRHGKLTVKDAENNFWQLENEQFRPQTTPAVFGNDIIAAMLEWTTDTLLIATIRQGIFYFDGTAFRPWQTSDDTSLKNHRILSASMLPNGQLAIGTAHNGLMVLDRQRRVVQHVNKKNGLQNNTVLSLLPVGSGSLWLGLDNGIDFVDLDAPFSTIYPDGDLQGTGYTIQAYDNSLYFGTNSGVYAIDWKTYYRPDEKQLFKKIANSDGQVWSLNLLDNSLLMGHHEGAFEINGAYARRLTQLSGVWRFVTLSPSLALAGHYNGLALFKKQASGWEFDGVLNGFSESSRILAVEPSGTVWMAHPYRGIYRIKVDAASHQVQSDFFDHQQGLPSSFGNHLFQLGDKVVFTAEKGVFDFDPASNRFVPNQQLTHIFGEKTRVQYLFQDKMGNIWYETDRETGVLLIQDETLEKKVRRLPITELRSRLTGGFQYILPFDKHNVIVSTEKGFLHFDLEKYQTKSGMPLHLTLHEVHLRADKDSLLFGGHQPDDLPELNLSYRQNALSFSFATPGCVGSETWVRYSHLLEGIGKKEWSEWSAETEVVLNHLPPGAYVFRVKARNQYGVESNEIRFAFQILPPWYASKTAYVFYGLLFAGAIAWVLLRQHKRFEREKQNLQDMHRHLEAAHEQQVRRSEAVISQLQQEKLQSEVAYKTEELASLAMHLVQKNAILQSMQEALEKLRKQVRSAPDLEKEINRIARMIETDANLDADWEHFSQNFDQVHSDFLKRLGEKYPGLTPSDYKLSAYLRLNLSSKEISTLMNISLRGVETGRYRLRKRLNLDTESNLTEFLMRF